MLLPLLAAPAVAHAVDCTSRPDLCGLHVESEINERNLEVAHDIVFIGDGFTASSLSRYRSIVAQAIAAMKALSPAAGIVAHDPTLFNFHRVDVISQTENVNNDSQGDTALGSRAPTTDTTTIRIPSTFKQRSLLEVPAANAPSFDTIVLIVNSPTGRGWSWLPRGHTTGGFVVLSTGGRLDETLNHELGHAIFNLADEYGSGTGSCNRLDEDDVLSAPNLTVDPTGRKFERAGRPTPVEGGLLSDRCIWRPASTCIMRSHFDAVWCPVCSRHIRVQLAERRNRDDRNAPFVAWSDSPPTQPVSGKVRLEAAGWDTRTLAKIELVVDGRSEPLPSIDPLVDPDKVGPMWPKRAAFEWDASIETNGRHELTLTAFDAAGQVDTIVRTYEVTGGDGSIARRKPAVQTAEETPQDPKKKTTKKTQDGGPMEASAMGCEVSDRPAGAGWLAVAFVPFLLKRRSRSAGPRRAPG